jgi:hypothetical protein
MNSAESHFSIHIEVKKKSSKSPNPRKLIIFNPLQISKDILKPTQSITPPRRSINRFKQEKSVSPRIPARLHLQPIVSSNQFLKIHRSITPTEIEINKKPRSLKFFPKNPYFVQHLQKNKYKKFTTSLFKLINSSKVKNGQVNENSAFLNSLNLSMNGKSGVLV